MVLIYKESKIDVKEIERNLQDIKTVQEEQQRLESTVEEQKKNIKEEFSSSDVTKWITTQYGSEVDILKEISKKLSINLTEASLFIKQLPIEPIIADKTIPDLVKDLRKAKRKLKGSSKDKLNKGINHLITAYEQYLQKSLDSIYWLKPYQEGFKKVGYSPKHIQKLHNVKDGETRESIINLVCKVWESDLEKKTLDYGTEYSNYTNIFKNSKKEIKSILKNIPHQSIRKSKKELIQKSIKEILCNNQGLSSNELHSRLSDSQAKISTPQSISKMLRKMEATKVDNSYYLVKDIIKKDLYSYVAGFIDSDGYITMDASLAPRVGMIATGDRGRAFFTELETELKCGRLHLDQKVGENSRSQHRLNFYSQNDIEAILNKCIPHLRMKQAQGNLLLEAIRIKRNYKKEDWAKPRLNEIFKLMKYENWKDSRGQGGREFKKYGIDPEVVVKYHDNCKMELMDSIESGVE
tara:strand:- start:10029 stop:11426 length:1398 start_codon:yes stop_codon:yes gene_type:complete